MMSRHLNESDTRMEAYMTRPLTARPLVLALAVAFPAAFSLPAHAQQAPDAGQSLQQLSPREIAPSRPGPAVALPPARIESVLPGGADVIVSRLRFTGNTVLTSDALLATLGDVTGKSYDLAGLKALSSRVTDIYRAAGYPFARAYLPEQKLGSGELQIAVIEGRYGKIDGGLAQAWLSGLAPGAVVESQSLERTTLVLSDQPGIKIAPLMRPGQETGTGDLVINAQRTPGFGGDISLDNHGNRYTGAYRAAANLHYDSPFLWGDQLTARVLASDEKQWLGSLGYSAPLGTSGLRGQLRYSHTAYELGKDFSNLDATGTAKVSGVGLSFPLIRSQTANINVSGLYQHKKLNNKNGLAVSEDDKNSDSLTLSLGFDRRDSLGGGGVTYGTLAYMHGQLDLDATLAAADIASGQDTRGSFDKWNLDLALLRATGIDNFTLFGRLSAQWAGKNLDSSEGYSLGGASGIRAYPQGEGTGDEGWFVQLEARYKMGAFSPYVFHDTGRITYNANNAQLTTPANPNSRSLAGSGFGLRHSEGKFNLDASLAWRSHGGAPTSDPRDDKPRAWVVARYAF